MSEQLELLTESPSHWTTVSYVTPEIQKKEIKPFVVLALKELEGNPDSRTSSLMNADKFSAVRAVVRHFARLRSATKEPWKQEDVTMFLEGLKFSPECTAEFTNLLCTEEMYENVPKHLRVKPGLLSLQWRIDMSLCQSNAQAESPTPQRLKELFHNFTYVILTLQLTDGTTTTYRLSIQKFHEIRYTVASALKNLIVMEKRKCMRKE
ncbi:uncharacterized protein LOC115447702 [Manduca sexta]|uniref:uncharacterized protein LOC115447702 n=1 Tax=Manduca sexta TaxID=7130 RepID=UPI00188FDBF9|nr:uncharacterized protein LOC115447702 [Manduca sexta]